MNKLFKIVGGALAAVIAVIIGVVFYVNGQRLADDYRTVFAAS